MVTISTVGVIDNDMGHIVSLGQISKHPVTMKHKITGRV